MRRVTRSSNPQLEPVDPEIDRTYHQRARHQRQQIMAEDNVNDNPRVDQPRIGNAVNDQNDNVQHRLQRRRAEYANEMPLIESFTPQIPQGYNAIGRQEINATNFELKNGVIILAQGLGFSGLSNEDPYLHLENLNEIADTIKINGVSRDAICLKLFPFSLKDRAKRWLQGLARNSVNSWEELATAFLQKFFPPSKTSKLKLDIAQYKQFELENLYETWERFKELLKQCPQHGYTDGDKVQIFYNGLTGPTRTNLDAAAGGAMLLLGPLQATDLIETMAMNTYQWPNERNQPRKTAGIYEVDDVTAMKAELAALKNQVSNLSMNRESPNVSSIQENVDLEDANFVNRQYNSRFNNTMPNTYSPAWRNHENFSYANNKNVLQAPPGFNTQQRLLAPPQTSQSRALVPVSQPSQQQIQPALAQGTSQFEEIIAYLKRGEERAIKQDARIDALESQSVNTQAQVRNFETHLGQLAQAMQNLQAQNLPSDTVPNPKQVQAITLRSGKQLEEPQVPEKAATQSKDKEPQISTDEVKDEEAEIQEEKKEDASKESTSVRKDYVPGRIIFSDNSPPYIPKLPFPPRALQKKDDGQFEKFLDMLRKMHINIPFVEALEQVPKYVKYMKDILSRKRKLGDLETVELTEECSAVIQHKLPPKRKDPGSFTIPCTIGSENFERCLCDLGASINLMPYSIFQKLGLGTYEPTSIVLQLADKSTTRARGVIEDVMIKVDRFIFPADFVIVDMAVDKKVPLILGRPFLATGRAIIDVEEGNLTLRFHDEKVDFNIFKALKMFDDEPYECNRIELIDDCVQDVIHECIGSNPSSLEDYVDIAGIESEKRVESSAILADEEIDNKRETFIAEHISSEPSHAIIADFLMDNLFIDDDNVYICAEIEKKSEEHALDKSGEGLTLKPLPSHLKYIFLGENNTFPVIVNARLTNKELHQLIKVLQENKGALAWSISDIKGISPQLVMHKILLEDQYKPTIEGQRRLNPTMKEVVKAEIIKL